MECFSESSHRTTCHWKGPAGYVTVTVTVTVTVKGKANPNAAWIYRDPKSAAAEIKDHVAFWHGVRVED